MSALIPLASDTNAIDAWGSRAKATTRALQSSECLRQLRLCGLPVVGEVGVVYKCPSKVCGHKHPCSATPVQGEIAGRIPMAGLGASKIIQAKSPIVVSDKRAVWRPTLVCVAGIKIAAPTHETKAFSNIA
jgi:hypothetical protein